MRRDTPEQRYAYECIENAKDLTHHQRKTLNGQVRANQPQAALKGLGKILRDGTKRSAKA